MSYIRVCDICGTEMRITTPRYKVKFDGWIYTQGKDICTDCYKKMITYITRRNSKLCGKQAEQIIIDEAVSEVTE